MELSPESFSGLEGSKVEIDAFTSLALQYREIAR